MIEIAAMATAVVANFLVPLLTKTAEGFANDLQGKASEGAANAVVGAAGKLWAKVKGAFTGRDAKDEERQAIELFEKSPEMMKTTAEQLVRQRLEKDEAFRTEIQALLEQATPEGGTVYQIAAETVGFVHAPYARIQHSEVVGVKIDRLDKPSSTPSPPPEQRA